LHNCGRRRDRPNERRLRTATNVHLRSRSGDEGSQGPLIARTRPHNPLVSSHPCSTTHFFVLFASGDRQRTSATVTAIRVRTTPTTTRTAASPPPSAGCAEMPAAIAPCGAAAPRPTASAAGSSARAMQSLILAFTSVLLLGWIEQARCESGPRNLTCARRGGLVSDAPSQLPAARTPEVERNVCSSLPHRVEPPTFDSPSNQPQAVTCFDEP